MNNIFDEDKVLKFDEDKALKIVVNRSNCSELFLYVVQLCFCYVCDVLQKKEVQIDFKRALLDLNNPIIKEGNT